MAVTISRYNHTAKLLLNKEIVYTTLKAMLLNATATFTASHTALTTVTNAGAYEVSGNGWAVGGETFGSVAVTVVDTNDAMLDAVDITKTASVGSIGPAYSCVVYDDTHVSDAPLWFIDFGGVKEAGVGTDFKITLNASGLYRTAD